MVTMQQLQNGLGRFVDTELTANMSGWVKPVAQTVAGLFISELPRTIEKHPIAQALSLVQDGMVDIDKAYAELVKHVTAPVPVPIKGIGTMMVTRENIDTLYRMILEG